MAGRPQRRMRERAFGMGLLPQRQSSRAVHMPAPVGGINTVSPASMMEATDCIALYNLIPYQYGLRLRSGWREHATDVSLLPLSHPSMSPHEGPLMDVFMSDLGGSDVGAWPGPARPGIRTLISFYGSNDKGLKDRLFACNEDGIWDVTQAGVKTLPVFGSADGWVSDRNAGYGVGTAFTNTAGEHFYAYCDGTNGYLLYRESTDAWTKITQTPDATWSAGTAYSLGTSLVNGGLTYVCTSAGTSQAKWEATTVYVVGDRRANGGYLYEVTSAGTSASAGGPTGFTEAVVDGTVTWKYVSAAGPLGSGTSITDGTCVWSFSPTISGVDPASFRHVMSWKNRLWFTQANSAKAFYLPVGQYAGSTSYVNFGSRFRYGGNLVGLWNWTVDGGVGIDDHLVGISSAGDVVIYTGTDPSSAATFGLKGVWWVGQVPPGRRIASSFGGDLFILSLVGCVPLSKLVAGYMIRDPNIYATAKIANLFNALMTERGFMDGWEINIHPTDNLLVINVPAIPGKTQEQVTMSLANKGWSRHIGVPMSCMEPWRGKLYFGTFDGRVCINDGFVDGMKLDGTGAKPIFFSLLTSFQNMGSAQKKRLHMARPLFITSGTVPGYAAESRWDFDLSDPTPYGTFIDPLYISGWDIDKWDAGTWGNGVSTAGTYFGAAGLGTHLAIVMRGSAITSTTLVGFDAVVDAGGIL